MFESMNENKKIRIATAVLSSFGAIYPLGSCLVSLYSIFQMCDPNVVENRWIYSLQGLWSMMLFAPVFYTTLLFLFLSSLACIYLFLFSKYTKIGMYVVLVNVVTSFVSLGLSDSLIYAAPLLFIGAYFPKLINLNSK